MFVAWQKCNLHHPVHLRNRICFYTIAWQRNLHQKTAHWHILFQENQSILWSTSKSLHMNLFDNIGPFFANHHHSTICVSLNWNWHSGIFEKNHFIIYWENEISIQKYTLPYQLVSVYRHLKFLIADPELTWTVLSSAHHAKSSVSRKFLFIAEILYWSCASNNEYCFVQSRTIGFSWWPILFIFRGQFFLFWI